MSENLPPELEQLKRFHGHLGPYVVVGYRMGLLARRELGEGHMSAVVGTGLKPPISCIVDGIQFSTACTLGKNNIRVEDRNEPRATFKLGGRELAVRLRDNVREKIDREMSKEKELEHSLFYYDMKEEEMFEVPGA